jgi:2-dehydro-3-deoxyphosphogluconate aldolase/(4S)-4-hydroxy-2-oxoglutarate aldolase
MTSGEVKERIGQVAIIPAVRVASAEDALFAADSIFRAGIPVIEMTLTVPGALHAIASLKADHPNAVIGAGTVLDLETARDCLKAGACFITSPGFDPEISRFGAENDVLVIPGVLTPSEVMMASRTGAQLIKIFPCAQVGGAAYIRTLRAPFPHIALIASGGVTQQTALEFIHAGAAALGIGEDLIPREAVRVRNADWIRELARRFLGMVKEGRARNSRH